MDETKDEACEFCGGAHALARCHAKGIAAYRAELINAVLTRSRERERALRQEQRERAREILEPTVPRHVYDALLEDCRAADARYVILVTQLADLSVALQENNDSLAQDMVKLVRGSAGLPPKEFDALAGDPMLQLGPVTQLAIEEFAAGDAEMRKYLVGRAHIELAALRADMDDRDADARLAAMIRAGDT